MISLDSDDMVDVVIYIYFGFFILSQNPLVVIDVLIQIRSRS